MTERFNVQPSPTTMTITGEIDGVAILFESGSDYWHLFDPAPKDRAFESWCASGSGQDFTVDEAVALVRVLVKVHRRSSPPEPEVASPGDARDSS